MLTGRSATSWARLRPTPATTAVPVGVGTTSTSTPASLSSPAWAPPSTADAPGSAGSAGAATTTSLGHLSRARSPTAATASTTASPPSIGTHVHSDCGAPGRHSTDIDSDAPGGLDQTRASRPRPPVCPRATKAAGAASPSSASRARSALVDPVSSTTETLRQVASALALAPFALAPFALARGTLASGTLVPVATPTTARYRRGHPLAPATNGTRPARCASAAPVARTFAVHPHRHRHSTVVRA